MSKDLIPYVRDKVTGLYHKLVVSIGDIIWQELSQDRECKYCGGVIGDDDVCNGCGGSPVASTGEVDMAKVMFTGRLPSGRELLKLRVGNKIYVCQYNYDYSQCEDITDIPDEDVVVTFEIAKIIVKRIADLIDRNSRNDYFFYGSRFNSDVQLEAWCKTQWQDTRWE